MIDVYEEDFTYILQSDPNPKASIYRNTERLAVTELPAISEDINSDNYDLLMLVLCWYVSMTVKKQMEEYA